MKMHNIESSTSLIEIIFVKHFEQCLVHLSTTEIFVEYINKTRAQTHGFGLDILVSFIVCPNHESHPGEAQSGHRS